MMANYSDLTVVVTGATGALGAGLCAAFVAAGATVVGVGRGRPEGPVDGVRYEAVDLTDDAQVGTFFDDLGAPWAVVNTVGGFAPHAPLHELDIDMLTRQLTLNLRTATILTKHSLRVMFPAGAGRIVHTASRAATDPHRAGFPYSVSKLGVLHLVRMASAETKGSGITVNAVSPSIIDTPANRAAMPQAHHEAWPKIPDIAQAYLFLAAPEAALVNGATLPV